MNKAFLVYQGDAWLSKNSLVLKGVYDSIEKALPDILEELSLALALNGEMTADNVANALVREHQTQGLETNYLIEVVTLNEWIA